MIAGTVFAQGRDRNQSTTYTCVLSSVLVGAAEQRDAYFEASASLFEPSSNPPSHITERSYQFFDETIVEDQTRHEGRPVPSSHPKANLLRVMKESGFLGLQQSLNRMQTDINGSRDWSNTTGSGTDYWDHFKQPRKKEDGSILVYDCRLLRRVSVS